MSTELVDQGSMRSRDLRYEISATSGQVTLTFENPTAAVTFSVDHRDASVLASDILTAITESRGH